MGYGAFGVSLTPTFSTAFFQWFDAGGLLAVPNVRGGGEYGPAWHAAGSLDKKQNGIDDFIAAAEWLIANRYTNPEKLAVYGGEQGTVARRRDPDAASRPASSRRRARAHHGHAPLPAVPGWTALGSGVRITGRQRRVQVARAAIRRINAYDRARSTRPF